MTFMQLINNLITTPHFLVSVLPPFLIASALLFSRVVRSELQQHWHLFFACLAANFLVVMVQVFVINSRFDYLALHTSSFVSILIFYWCYTKVRVPTAGSIYLASWITIVIPDVFGAVSHYVYTLNPVSPGEWVRWPGGAGWFDYLVIGPVATAILALIARKLQLLNSESKIYKITRG